MRTLTPSTMRAALHVLAKYEADQICRYYDPSSVRAVRRAEVQRDRLLRRQVRSITGLTPKQVQARARKAGFKRRHWDELVHRIYNRTCPWS